MLKFVFRMKNIMLVLKGIEMIQELVGGYRVTTTCLFVTVTVVGHLGARIKPLTSVQYIQT